MSHAHKVVCVFLIVVVSKDILLHVELGRKDHRKYAPHFSRIKGVNNIFYIKFPLQLLGSRTILKTTKQKNWITEPQMPTL